MNKLLSLLLVALAVTLVPSTASAGGFSVFGSWWDNGDADETIGFGARVGVGLVGGLDLDIRATYFDDVEAEIIGNIIGHPSQRETGIESIPVDVGLRFNLGSGRSGGGFYLGGGGTYYKLDGDGGEVDDEVGYYALAGLELGDREGGRFFVEATYRTVEATVELDPEELEDLPDVELIDEVELDMGGFSANAGFTWSW